MTNLTGKTLVERLRAAANDGELSSDTFEQAADRIEALEREVRGLIDDAGHDAEAIAAGKDRIEALKAETRVRIP